MGVCWNIILELVNIGINNLTCLLKGKFLLKGKLINAIGKKPGLDSRWIWNAGLMCSKYGGSSRGSAISGAAAAIELCSLLSVE